MNRIFIAAALPEAVRSRIHSEVAISLSKVFSDHSVRIIAKDSLHLTLKFLGETAEAKIPGIANAVAAAARAANASALLRTGQIQLFTPFVVAIGIDDLTGSVSAVQADLDERLESLGFQREARRFRPHVTIGRSRGRQRVTRRVIFERIPEFEFSVESLVLMRSDLGSVGAKYSPLSEFRLA
ncbi:MAG: RNA 2',3'-cyclic phosphodiesterase [Blastocatellia bacterium]